ncbi:MAG: GGDEF domain-containing protein [Gammaproteobacteria bacterium]|nr:GGDEF domain-containing protein [Gammaproteobacteria bacterium]
MDLRFSLADKISVTVIIVGLCGVMLVYYISNSYKTFAYQHHALSVQQLAYLETNDLFEDLKSNSLDLALAIEHENNFQRDFNLGRNDDLTQQLNDQFYQYFVTAGVIKLLKLYVLDTDFTLLSTSTEGVSTESDSEIICPGLSRSALERLGSAKLQTISGTCLYKGIPVFAVIVPFGGLNPKGYIQVITDLAYSLQKVEQSLAMPIQINALNEDLIYQSKNWDSTLESNNCLIVHLPITDKNDKPMMDISLLSDMTTFNKEVQEHRNWIMALAFFTTAFTIFIVLFVLQKSTIPPLAKIHDVLERIHLNAYTESKNNRLLFEQLLEQIIKLRHKLKAHFCVMILDLTHFKNVNSEYGKSAGDQLLLEVEHRLGAILRESDLISWVGTDTPGHKLLPSGTKTQYRATIARLGGDEFGLLLPSAETEDQAKAVAQRIVETLNTPFHIKDYDINIKCRIGISIYPVHGKDEKILIRNADKAMYQAKALDQTVFIFDPKADR